MKFSDTTKEVITIIIAGIILGAIWSYPGKVDNMPIFILFFLIIISVNLIAKKYVAFKFEAELKTKFWSIYHYGFKQGSHFKAPVYMLWLPILLSLISRGMIKWIPLLEFDVSPKIERVARRHEGMYRFTEILEWQIALIVMGGIIANLLLSLLGYIFAGYIPGGELFSRLNIYYALWALLPISGLDGAKMFFGSRPLWFTFLVITLIFFVFSFITFI